MGDLDLINESIETRDRDLEIAQQEISTLRVNVESDRAEAQNRLLQERADAQF